MNSKHRRPAQTGATALINAWMPDYSHKIQENAIIQALNLRPVGRDSWQGGCPACNYPEAFSLVIRNGKLLWHCHACQDKHAVLAALRGGVPLHTAPVPRVGQKPTDKSKLEFVRRLWGESLPIADTMAERYLAGRGLQGLHIADLRFLPTCRHTPTGQNYPAMIAAVRRWPANGVVAVHRTFLKQDGSGKIDHPQARMMLGDATGGAVQLAQAGEQLALAEGIETALSVLQATGIPTWACLSTAGLQRIMVPDTVRVVLICADHDPPGLKAAHAAAERLHRLGKQVRLAAPPQAGADFNDILKGVSHD